MSSSSSLAGEHHHRKKKSSTSSASAAVVSSSSGSKHRSHHQHHRRHHDEDDPESLASSHGGAQAGGAGAASSATGGSSASSSSSSSSSLPPSSSSASEAAGGGFSLSEAIPVDALWEWLERGQRVAVSVYERARTDATFRQKLQLGALVAITVVMLVAQISHFTRRGGGLGDGVARALPALGGGAGDGSGAGEDAGGKRKGVVDEADILTKLRYEAEELNFDVSGGDLLSVRRRFGTRAENEKAQAAAGRRADKRCLKFSATVSRDTSEYSYYTPHKVFDLPVLQRSLKRLGWQQEEDLKKATLVLKGVPRVTFRQLKEGKQYYDMVASLSRIGSKKKTQLATLRAHVKKFGCSFESLNIQPKSWDMSRSSECKQFFEEHDDKGRMIVFKSCNKGEGSKGAGISVADDISDYREQWGKCVSGEFNYVAQHYIERPMLIKNRKFDMRIYILVASTQPYVVFFNPGYVRRSLAEYKPTSTEKNDVLTNYHVQVTRSDFSPEEALWSFAQFMEYVKGEKLCKACGDIEIQLSKIARLVFDAGREYYVRHPGSFQLVGLDFMMDANLRPMFIEGNVSPGLGSHELKWKKELMDDLIAVMYEQVTTIHERPDEFSLVPGDRIYGAHDNYWQVLVHEALEQCDKTFTFDPCKELIVPWRTWLH